MKKRLSLLLAFLLVIGLIAVNVIAEGTDYASNVEGTAVFNPALNSVDADGVTTYGVAYITDDPSAGLKMSMEYTISLEGLMEQTFYIADVYVDVEDSCYWYLLEALEGQSLPGNLATKSWVYQNDIPTDAYLDTLLVTPPAPKPTDPTDPSDPSESCGCCDKCTNAAGCQCGCEECDFCENETPTEPEEYPNLEDSETGVKVTLESLPQGVSLEVNEPDSSAALNAFRIPESRQVFALDISLRNADSTDYQPGAALVKVPVSAAPGTKLGIVHKHGDEDAVFMGVTEVLSDGTVEFFTDSFSEFAGFTVDFHYNGVDFSIDGKTSIKLSELFAVMNIPEDAYAAESVVFSNDSLVTTERLVDGDWMIHSIDAFDTNETLVITFTGGRTIVIDVTDAIRVDFDFGTTDVSGHFNHQVVGFKNITVTLYKGNTSEIIGKTSTIDGVYGSGWLKLESSKYWFQIRSISGFLKYTDGHGYNDGSSQGEHHIAFRRDGSTNPTILVNCWPLEITDSNPSQYCSLKRKSKIINSDADDVASRDVVIRVYRNGGYETVQTISNLSFPDRNGDGDGHDVINFSRDLEVTSVATGYELAATHDDSNRTYYVDLNLINYTITYDYAGGVGTPPSKSYTIEDTLLLPTPTKAGYDFKGWKVTTAAGNWSNGTIYDENTTSVAAGKYGNVTFTAQWKAKTYKVTLDAQNGTGESDGTTAYWYMYNTTKDVNGETVYYWTNAACTSPLHNYTITKPTKKGHTFGGYYEELNGGGIQYVNANGMCINNLYAAVADNSTLYAKWNAKTFTVNYYSNGGSGSMDSHTVVYGNTIQIKDNAFTAPSGKRFAGWAVSATGTAGEHGWSKEDKTGWSGTWTFDNGEKGIANESLNLYAIWEDAEHTVTWKNWDGTILDTDTVAHGGSTTYDKAKPSRPDAGGYSHNFNGWDKGTNGTVSNVTTDTTVTAQFSKTPISYIASFDYNGGDAGVPTKIFTVESALTLPKLTKTGYTGKWIVTEVEGNWTNGAEFASEGSVAAGKYGNVTFTAQWTPITYKIQFAGGEGGQGSMAEITATYDKDVTLPENQFQRIIKVTYDVNGGKNLDPSDTVVSLEATFKNWISGSETYDDKASVKNLASTQDAVVQMTAQWNLKSTTTPTVEKDGYTFGGWKLKDAATDLYEAEETITPARDITLVAQWNPISYTITYDSNGGSAVAQTSYTHDTNVILASAPTREGYKFTGWKLKNKLLESEGNWEDTTYTADQTIGTGKYGDITLVAQWEVQYRYQVIYEANIGTGEMVSGMPSNVDSDWIDANKYTVDLSAKPTRANYDFLGWATSQTATKADVLTSYELEGIANSTATTTLYAVWQRHTGNLALDHTGTKPAIVTVEGEGLNITLVLSSDMTITDLPTGTYRVTAKGAAATTTVSVSDGNPVVTNQGTTTVTVTVTEVATNWFTGFCQAINIFKKEGEG